MHLDFSALEKQTKPCPVLVETPICARRILQGFKFRIRSNTFPEVLRGRCSDAPTVNNPFIQAGVWLGSESGALALMKLPLLFGSSAHQPIIYWLTDLQRGDEYEA